MNNNLVESNSDINTLLDVDSLREDVDIDGLIYEGYKHLDYIVEHEDEKLIELRKIIVLLNRIIEYFKNSSISSNDDINKLLVDSKNRIEELINEDASGEKIASVLDTILIRVSSAFESSKKEEEKEELKTSLLMRLGDLYSHLYEAIRKNDIKNTTYYRGKIISELRSHKKEIDSYYQSVKLLDELSHLIEKGSPKNEILECLIKNGDSKYYQVLRDNVDNTSLFYRTFHELYNKLDVKRIVLYREALAKELNDQREDLDKRYSNEFLDKKGTISGVATVLPNAIGLAIQKVGVAADELKEANTSRMSFSKTGGLIKEVGRLVTTPAVFLGKFIANNWYSLYFIGRTIQNGLAQKRMMEEQDNMDVQAEATVSRHSGGKQQAIDECQRNLGVSKEEAESIVGRFFESGIKYETQVEIFKNGSLSRLSELNPENVSTKIMEMDRAVLGRMRACGETYEEAFRNVSEEFKSGVDFSKQIESYNDIIVGRTNEELSQAQREMQAMDRAVIGRMLAYGETKYEALKRVIEEHNAGNDYNAQAELYTSEINAKVLSKANNSEQVAERAAEPKEVVEAVGEAAEELMRQNPGMNRVEAINIAKYILKQSGVEPSELKNVINQGKESAEGEQPSLQEQPPEAEAENADSVEGAGQSDGAEAGNADSIEGAGQPDGAEAESADSVEGAEQPDGAEAENADSVEGAGQPDGAEAENADSVGGAGQPDGAEAGNADSVEGAGQPDGAEAESADSVEGAGQPEDGVSGDYQETTRQMVNFDTPADPIQVDLSTLSPEQLASILPRMGQSFNRDAAMSIIVDEWGYNYNEAAALCDLIEQISEQVNESLHQDMWSNPNLHLWNAEQPQTQSYLRPITEEDMEHMHPVPIIDDKPSWVIVDSPGGMDIIIPRFMVSLFTDIGYVENHGILWAPETQAVDDALGTHVTR